MEQQEFDAGDGQLIVLYAVEDIGAEIDPVAILQSVAEDAARRAADGQRLVSLSSLSQRHAGAFLSREGSGFETKVSMVGVYSRRA